MPGLIDDYVAVFRNRLGFDRRLARRAAEEVESHLRESAAALADAGEAVRRFGDPLLVARDYAEAALPARLRTVWSAMGVLTLATFIFMRLRTIWLAPPTPIDLPRLSFAIALDRAGFLLGTLLAVGALAAGRIGASDRTARVLPLSAAAFAALTTSIAASLYRAWLLLPSADGSGLPAVVATGAVEAVILFVVVWQLRMLHRHAELATSVAAQSRSSRKARTSA